MTPTPKSGASISTTDISSRSSAIATQLTSLDRQIVVWRVCAFGLAGAGVVVSVVDFIAQGASDLADLGTLLAGTVAPVWSLAGLLIVYLAFLGQRRQIVLQEEGLELSRQELRETREELKGQKQQLELQRTEMGVQNATMRRQAFEQSFFELLRFHRDIVTSLQARPGNAGDYGGQVAFQVAVSELDGRMETAARMGAERTHEEWLNVMSEYFVTVCLSPKSDFGNYFRALYHMLRLIEESGLPKRARYASLLRAQLSNAELSLIALDGLSRVGRDKFKPLIERYGMLKPVRLPSSFERFRSYYAPSAFSTAQVD